MNEKCYFAVIAEMKPFFDSQGFVKSGDVFKNEQYEVKIWYDEEIKCFKLGLAQIEGDVTGELAVLENWLFDETQTEKDAVAVGVEFTDTLRSKLGIKKTAARGGAADISLPLTEKGESVNILTLTQKLLAIFPEKKETYKESVAKYGKYLYVDFIAGEFVPEIKELLASEKSNKKQIKKLFDMLSETYVDGDKTTADMIVALISAAIFGDENLTAAATPYFSENQHLKTCVNELTTELKINRKLRAALKIEK